MTSLNPTPPTVPDTLTFSYDGYGRRVGIVESHGSTVLTSKTFVWIGASLCQERDSTGHTVTKQFFDYGEQINGTNYYYTLDHLGSVREMTTSSGTVQASYDYDAFGRQAVFSQAVTTDFGYTGMYMERAANLELTLYRAYDANMGRWLNRDPLAEFAGNNLYEMVNNNPFQWVDPFGLWGSYKNKLPPNWNRPVTPGDVKLFCDCVGLACAFVLPEIPLVVDSGDLTLYVLGLSNAQKVKNIVGLAGAAKGALGIQQDIKDNQTAPTPQTGNPPNSGCHGKK